MRTAHGAQFSLLCLTLFANVFSLKKTTEGFPDPSVPGLREPFIRWVSIWTWERGVLLFGVLGVCCLGVGGLLLFLGVLFLFRFWGFVYLGFCLFFTYDTDLHDFLKAYKTCSSQIWENTQVSFKIFPFKYFYISGKLFNEKTPGLFTRIHSDNWSQKLTLNRQHFVLQVSSGLYDLQQPRHNSWFCIWGGGWCSIRQH